MTEKLIKEELVLTSAELKKRDDLVAVDGVLYDVKKFAKVHPGGGQIEMAGAYDASALYHSMHTHGDPMNSKLLQSYRIGVHKRDPRDIEDPVYIYDSPFAKDLKRSVQQEMGKQSWYATAGFKVRTFCILAFTLICEYYWITTGKMLYGAAVGFFHCQIGLSVQHDASHGAISSDSRINSIFAWGADWIGHTRWIWMQQHILWHHPHTNHQVLDPDTTSAEPFNVYKDYSKEINVKGHMKKPPHLFVSQEWITNLVLTLYGPSLVYNFVVLFTMRHNERVPKSVTKGDFMYQQWPMVIAWRLFYYYRMVYLPWYIGGAYWLSAMFIVSFFAGSFLTFVFVLSHNFEGSERDPCRLAGNNGIVKPVCWYKAQVETSSSYGGVVAMLLTGGLNMQIEHHLFPRMSSWHYPRISRAVRECCKRHGVNYVYFPYMWTNMTSMLRYMRKVGIIAVMKHATEEF